METNFTILLCSSCIIPSKASNKKVIDQDRNFACSEIEFKSVSIVDNLKI